MECQENSHLLHHYVLHCYTAAAIGSHRAFSKGERSCLDFPRRRLTADACRSAAHQFFSPVCFHIQCLNQCHSDICHIVDSRAVRIQRISTHLASTPRGIIFLGPSQPTTVNTKEPMYYQLCMNLFTDTILTGTYIGRDPSSNLSVGWNCRSRCSFTR
jgi:hypothetical protein